MLAAKPVDFDPAQTEILAREGQVLRLKVRILRLPPAMDYEIKVAHLDEKGREVLTHERGGIIRRWHHRVSVRPLDNQVCRYQDQVDIDAGPLTPLVWAYAHGFYRYRQYRWRQLALGAEAVIPIV